ncbi:MAG: hypothetical protein K6T66_06590 [Peptococcaceae bacterium]|nr:hypothetical protein [Peptococcaceae bacterium]
MAEVWERQPGESSKAYAAFCVYRDLGPERSLEKALQNLSKKRAKWQLWQWSSKYNWVARCQAYDDYIERRKREEKERAILEMAERHARLAVAFQQKVVERLRELNPAELEPRDLSKWLDIAVKVERLARGEPTEIGKQEVTLPAIVEVVTDEKDTDTVAPGTE